MTGGDRDLTIAGVDDVTNPERRDYRRHIDVRFSNGTVARHAVDDEHNYVEEIHQPPNGATRDGRVVQTDVAPDQLPDVVDAWTTEIREAIETEDTERWDVGLIRDD